MYHRIDASRNLSQNHTLSDQSRVCDRISRSLTGNHENHRRQGGSFYHISKPHPQCQKISRSHLQYDYDRSDGDVNIE